MTARPFCVISPNVERLRRSLRDHRPRSRSMRLAHRSTRPACRQNRLEVREHHSHSGTSWRSPFPRPNRAAPQDDPAKRLLRDGAHGVFDRKLSAMGDADASCDTRRLIPDRAFACHQAEIGHDLPFISAPDRTPEGLLHSETCRVTYSSISTLAVNRPGGRFGQQCAGKPAFNGQSGSTAEIWLAVEKSHGAVPIDPSARNPHLTYIKWGGIFLIRRN